MPYGLPAATVTVRDCAALDVDSLRMVAFNAGAKLAVLHAGADQDGWDGDIICRTADGRTLAFPKDSLRL